MNQDQPDSLPLDHHSCVLAAAFICPYHSRGSTRISCERFKVDLSITKATIAGTIGERHPIKVGVRTWECRRKPPVFSITEQRPRRSRKNVVDESEAARRIPGE